MKKSFSTRLLSIFLAILMIVTTVPAFAVTAQAGTDGCKYLFAYFTGNSRDGQKIRFAVSADGYQFDKINGGNPVIRQAKYENETSDGFARDPYIFPSHDGSKYYIIATDLDSSGLSGDAWSGDSCFVMWESEDLCSWTQMPVIDARTFSNANVANDFATTIRAWAPQVIWDDSANQYMIYWSQYFGNWANQGIYYTHTTDFQSFTAPKLLYAPSGCDGIDADIQYVNGKYYMYYKDETNGGICYVTSNSLTGPYNSTPVKISQSTKAVEGCNAYQIGNSSTYAMLIDEYASGGFFIQTSNDMVNWTRNDSSNVSSLSARHGSVIQITDEQYNTLRNYNNWLKVETNKIQYRFDAYEKVTETNWDYTVHNDPSGYSYDLMVNAGANGQTNGSFYTSNGVAHCRASNMFINDDGPNEIVRSESFTMSLTHKRVADKLGNADFKNNGYVFGLANNGTDFVALKQDGTFFVRLSDGSVVTASVKAIVDTGVESTYTVTYDGSATRLYQDGNFVAKINGQLAARSGYIGLGFTDQAGAQCYSDFSSVTFYNTWMDDEEVMDAVLQENLDSAARTSKLFGNSGYKANATTYWYSDKQPVSADEYPNLLISNSEGCGNGVSGGILLSNNNNYIDKGYNKFKITTKGNNVFWYTGTGCNIQMPIQAEILAVKYATGTGRSNLNYCQVNGSYTSGKTDGSWDPKGNWFGFYDNKNDAWQILQPYAKNEPNNAQEFSASTSTGSNYSVNQNNNNTSRLWRNALVYTPNFGGNYYDIQRNLYVQWMSNKETTTTNLSNVKLCVLDYSSIGNNANAIRVKYNNVIANKDKYCDASLIKYLHAVNSIFQIDPTGYFDDSNTNYGTVESQVMDCSLIIQNCNNAGYVDIAKDYTPLESEVKYGNIFDFDRYAISSSAKTGNNCTVDVNTTNRTVTVNGTEGDNYTAYNFNADSYKLKVEPGQRYTFYCNTSASNARVMLFFPTVTATGSGNTSDSQYYSAQYGTTATGGSAGYITTTVTVPDNVEYMFLRLGTSSNVSNTFSNIKIFKEAYGTDDYCSYASSSACNSTKYGAALATPPVNEGKHFCGWYAEESYETKVESASEAGCRTLYALYGNVVKVDGKAPSCVDAGATDYYKCDACGTITVPQEVIPALGHNYTADDSSFNWTALTVDSAAATATFTCTDCGYTEDVTATITSTTTAPTCTQPGSKDYTATASITSRDNQTVTATDSKSVAIAPTGHLNYNDPTWVWADDYSSAKATFVCTENDDTVEVDAVIDTLAYTPANCTNDGSAAYKATVTFNGKEYVDTKAVTFEKTGHDFVYTPAGENYHNIACKNCDYKSTEACDFEISYEDEYERIYTCAHCTNSYSEYLVDNYKFANGSIVDKDGNVVDTYDTSVYNATEKVYFTINRDKYTSEGLAILDNAFAEFEAIQSYVYLDPAKPGQKGVADIQVDINNAINGLISAINTIDDANNNYINLYTVTYSVQSADDASSVIVDTVTTENVLYGTPMTLSFEDIVPGEDYYPVSWKIEDTKETGKKISKFGSIEKYDFVVTSDVNIIITAGSTPTVTEGKYLIRVVDYFNRFVKTVEIDELPTVGRNISCSYLTADDVQTIPFYTFSGKWDITSSDGYYTAKPRYVITDTYEIAVIGGTVSGSKYAGGRADYDSIVTVTPNDSIDAYGWVVNKGGKYQIVSYCTDTDKTYSFNVCDNEAYIPFYKDGDKFVTAITRVVLDSTNVEGMSGNAVAAYMSDDEFLNYKLENKLPFVYIEKAMFMEDGHKARVYARVTEGFDNTAANNFNYGVQYTATVNGVTKERLAPINNKLSYSGQYVYTLNSSANPFESAAYKAYANYDFTYTLGDQTVTVNVNDISAQKDCE